jgi:hypothetical protein
MPLPQLPECWDYRCGPPYPDYLPLKNGTTYYK